jgi:pimeloyl-ACP methyl ester carboxylesterase
MSPLHFHPPQELKDELGPFRSPLLFDNGTQASNALEWSRRRQEILDYWHGVMGQWPALLTKPQFSVLEQEREKGFSRMGLSMSLAPGQSQQGWLLVPDGEGPFPAVLVVYYDPDTGAGLKPAEGAHRDYGLQLVQEGFVALCIGTPAGDARKPDTGEATCQPLSFYAYVAANAWILLASLPQVEAQRIGIVGHSYGGKWALFAGALWEKFAAIAISDPGIVWDETRANVNYWEPWYLGHDNSLAKQRQPGIPTEQNPRTGAYKRLIDEGHDLTDLHALICPRPFLISGGSEDPVERWMALNHARAVNEVLQIKEPRIAMTNRPDHTPDEYSNAVLRSFFRHFLGNA